MKKNTITVAGESLQDLEAALDHFDITFEECGCVSMSGSLPEHLSQALERALKTIEAEITEYDDEVYLDDEVTDPVRQLFLRIGAAYAEQG